MKVLVSRTDKLGDVVLSLPVFAYIKQMQPTWQVHAMVAPASVPLVENDPHLDAVWTYSDELLPDLVPDLAGEAFDAAILLYYQRPLASALKRLGVGRRVGPFSKWSSWFLLNRGVWQNRSRVRHHECDYNVKLAQKLVGKGGVIPNPQIYLSAGQREIGRQFLEKENVSGRPVVFIHPGSGGSALNWEPRYYAEVANQLAASGVYRVFVTGADQDTSTIAKVEENLHPAVKILAGRYPLRDFLGVLDSGDLFIGPSTGPLHMAAALGLGVVGLYPPLAIQGITRWGPLGTWSTALAPSVKCPSRIICYGERCRHWNCMNGIAVDEVVAVAAETLQWRNRDQGNDDPASAVH